MDLDPAFNTTLPLSWSRIHDDARRLAAKLKGRPFKGIVAVARGGLVPAAILARELDIRLVETVCVSSYGDGHRHELEVLRELHHDGTGWLVVDDLVDTGNTARVVRAMLPGAHYATLYAKPEGRPLTDTFVEEIAQSVWVVFPWDEEI